MFNKKIQLVCLNNSKDIIAYLIHYGYNVYSFSKPERFYVVEQKDEDIEWLFKKYRTPIIYGYCKDKDEFIEWFKQSLMYDEMGMDVKWEDFVFERMLKGSFLNALAIRTIAMRIKYEYEKNKS